MYIHYMYIYICYINYIYICYIYYIYIILYKYIYIYIYIYISRAFPTKGMERIHSSSQIFAHSPGTWNNFLPNQRLFPFLLNKSFNVMKQ